VSEAGAAEPTGRRPSSTRTKARKRALDILFESELRGTDPLQTLAERAADATPPVRDYTATLVEGVHAHADAIDDRIAGP
jgi:N utilization substance protein B